MSVFVTGAESFVGRALAMACDELSIQIEGVDHVKGVLPRWQHADIRDPALADLIPDGSIVVHLAAISRDSDCRLDPKTAFDVNVNGTLNVAEAARKRGCTQIVFASSEWVYGDVSNTGVQAEDAAIDGTRLNSEYAISKLVAERLLQLGSYVPATTILRFGIIYGPRESNFSAVESLLKKVHAGDRVEIGSARTARRFIHVDDIAAGIVASFGRRGCEVFNLCGSDLVTLRDVVEASARVTGMAVELIETASDRPSIRNPVNDRALRELSWRPEIDLEEGLRSVLEGFEAVR